MSAAFDSIVIDLVVILTLGSIVGLSLSTQTYFVSSIVLVPSVVTIFSSYTPVSVSIIFSLTPLFASSSSYSVTIISFVLVGSSGFRMFTGPDTVTVVVPICEGVTFTFISVFITCELSNILGVATTFSPFCAPSADFVISILPASMFSVSTNVASDSTGPFPAISVTCVFTKYSVL